MLRKHVLVAALAAAVCGGLTSPAWCQAVKAKAAPALDLDAAPANETPDPLTPPEKSGPAPAAPGAPPAAAEPRPAGEVHPVVQLVREKLAAAPSKGPASDRDDQAGLAAFYAQGNGQPVWVDKEGFTARARLAIAEIKKADDWGLKAAAFDLPAAPESSASNDTLADIEVKLGLAVLKYARHARGGRIVPSSISRLLDQKPTIYDPKTLMQAIAVSDAADAYLRNLHPKHPQFEKLRKALLSARGAKPDEAPGADVKIPPGPQLKPGQDHAQVVLLRQRLAVAATTEKGSVYDEALVEAVKAYQRQRGLEPTGIVNGATREALNDAGRTAAAGNIQRLIVNMERWRWLPEDLGSIYVWDSVPDQMTSVVDGGKVVLSEKIVVGKPSSPTPIFSADMQFIIFHPSWGVPPGMKRYELWPQLRESGGGWFSTKPLASAVLNAHGLRVSRGGVPINPDSINWSSVDIGSFDFTQPPGPQNVLGIVKFRFPNRHDVYMHDTPERHLFGGAVRAFSHGCMRVQNPIRLAEVLLAHDKGWSSDKVQEYVKRGGEIKLTTPIPVHITYFTATADEEGRVQYRADLYGLDSRTATALEGQAVHLVTGSVASEGAAPRVRPAAGVRKKAPAQKNWFDTLFGN